MSEKPIISVLMGVYYRSAEIALLERSIASILSQTMPDFELLICDDGSAPEAIELLNRLGETDLRIRLIRRGNLFSLPSKLNACLREAKGIYLARMDDDDCACPLRFEKQLAYLESHPGISFVGSDVNLIRDGELVGQRHFPPRPEVRDFYMTQPFIHPTLVFRREALEAVNGYSEERHCILCEDYDLLLRIYAAGHKGANLQECLLDYTIPVTAKGARKMKHRWNEAVTRYHRFRELGLLPGALPWVVKPLAVGLLPGWLLERLKMCRGGWKRA